MIPKNNDLFDKAQHSYNAEDYQTALQIYEQISPKTAAVWNNMANAAYKSGDTAHAQLYWLRAQKNSSRIVNSTIMHNLTVAQISFPPSYRQRLNAFCSSLTIQILFFCFFSVFLIIIARYIRQKKYSFIFLLSMICMASGTLTYQLYREQKNSYGLVMADSATVYIGPGTLYHSSGQIAQGTRVLLCAQKDGWEKIAWDNTIGWIPSSDIETI